MKWNHPSCQVELEMILLMWKVNDICTTAEDVWMATGIDHCSVYQLQWLPKLGVLILTSKYFEKQKFKFTDCLCKVGIARDVRIVT